jgi:hypothetical protein
MDRVSLESCLPCPPLHCFVFVVLELFDAVIQRETPKLRDGEDPLTMPVTLQLSSEAVFRVSSMPHAHRETPSDRLTLARVSLRLIFTHHAHMLLYFTAIRCSGNS